MKRKLLLTLTALFLLMAGAQTAMAQKVTLYVEGNKAYECSVSQLDSIVFSEAPAEEELIVTVDAYGNADGGHFFTKIDESNFYIDNIKYTAVSGNLEVTGYDKAYFSGAAKIISKLIYDGRTMNVTSIGDEAFYECSSLTSVTIPNSVTSIGSSAFEGCTGLTSVTIPNSVTSIGEWAFYYCTSLKKVIVPDIAAWCAISFGNGYANPLFYYAEHLYSDETTEITDLIIPNSVISIGRNAFFCYSGLTSVTIPNSVTSIGDAAFWGCSGLTSVTIPNSVTNIGDAAFNYCTSLTSVTIPNSVTNIGEAAFSNCTSLTSITIPNSVTSISFGAFAWCSGLTSVTIPESVTSIDFGAFQGCSSLTSVTIPNSVTSIGYSAFGNCSGLKDVYCLAESVPETSDNAFDYSSIESATLHVPAGSVNAYKYNNPWSGFKTIVAIQ